jgi:hypothetical protein
MCGFMAAVIIVSVVVKVKVSVAESSSGDSLRAAVRNESTTNLQGLNANRITPEEEGDAFQRKVFNSLGTAAQMGSSVSDAGDVNGDGYDDVIVGARAFNSGTGRAYIYFGGQNMNTIADVVLSGETVNSLYGDGVSSAGDVNGDGYDDVIVGAPGYNTQTGRAYIYFGGSLMNNVADVTINGEATYNSFGKSVSSAGDVNGDGYADVVVGAWTYPSSTGVGRVYVFYGGTSMNNVPDVTMTGEAASNSFGYCVSTAGDVNGDGYSDVLVGAHGNNSSRGKAYIYFGSAAMNNVADVTFLGEAPGNIFGFSVSTAGDVNGDGYWDIVVGADQYSSGLGRSYIYYGGSVMNNTADVTMTGAVASDRFGRSVAYAGDLNGDSYSDVAVSSFRNDGVDSGKVFVFFGGEGMNNIADAVIYGETYYESLGWSVSTAGDVNGDGFDDLIAGGVSYKSLNGRAILYDYFMKGEIKADRIITGDYSEEFGNSMSNCGDVNGDGFDDIVIAARGYNGYSGRTYICFGGSTPDLTADLVLYGESTNDLFGSSVSSAGDVNGDGYDDVIVGAYGNNSQIGKAYIYFGGNSMDNIPDVLLFGESVSSYFGITVAGCGDVNGDGFEDVIAGATGFDNSRGKVYLFFGGSTMDNVPDKTFTGESTFSRFGAAISGAGDVNGDGYADIIVGSDQYNSYTGRTYLFLGGNFIGQFPFLTIDGAAPNNYFGSAVSGAGDMNRDGFDDVIVGAFGNNNYNGTAYIFFGGSIMDVFADVYISNGVSSSGLGTSLSDIGDVNRDGFDDVVVSAPGFNQSMGKSYVLLGGSYVDNVPDVIMTGDTANIYFGGSVSFAGDFNGDGYDDFMANARNFSTLKGMAYIYLSSAININPNLIFVKDFPNDQGGKIQIKWSRSGYDVIGTNKITSYTIFRSFPPSGGNYNWQAIADVTAENLPFYYYLDNTPVDSSSLNNGLYYYRIKAKTNYINEYWYSDILSGRSVDNLAPLAVSGFASFDQSGTVRLRWNKNAEPDLYNYVLYRSTNPSIDPNLATPIAATTDTTYADNSPLSGLYYYFILAQDIHNNKSPLASVQSPNILLNITMFMQGSYNPATDLQTADTIRAFLRYSSAPYVIADSSTGVLGTNGIAPMRFPNAMSGNYYLTIKHRNSIETWNAALLPVARGGSYSYNFSIAPSQAFGGNQIQVDASPVRFAIYSGDVNQDGTVDATDVSAIDNAANIFLSGYVATDLTGDNFVDGTDFAIADNNAANFVSVIRP